VNLLLYFLLLVTGGAAYYEYTTQAQTTPGFQTQIDAWHAKINALQDDNKKLKAEQTALDQQAAAAKSNLDQLNTILATTQKGLEDATASEKEREDAAAKVAAAAMPVNTNALGTITTLLGQTYKNCQLLKVEANGITISHADGITQVPYVYMRPALQRRFGYDPEKAATLDEAQIRYQEQLRQASAGGGQ
jgi:hypothetical protein